MQMTFQIEGLDQITKATDIVKKEVYNELNKALLASATRVHKKASKSLTDGKKSGRIYRSGKGKTVGTAISFGTDGKVSKQGGFDAKFHQASAAGEAPANDTGTLLRSLSFYGFKDKLEAIVISRLKYAKMLEFGTTKIKARPFLFPAYEKSKAWIQERLNKAVRDAAIKSIRK